MTRASDTARLLGAGATILDGTTITTADNTAQLELVSTDADSGIGPHQVFYRNSSSPADADLLCELDFRGRNDNSQDVNYATVNVKANDVSDGTEDGEYILQVMTAGSVDTTMHIKPAEIVFNEDSIDRDFRVESDNDANAFFVEGSTGNIGIGTSSPNAMAKLDILGSAGAQTGANQAFNIKAPTTTAGQGVGIRLSAASGSNEAVGIIGVVNEASGNLGAMTFHTYDGGSDVPECMRINSSQELLLRTTVSENNSLMTINNASSHVGKNGITFCTSSTGIAFSHMIFKNPNGNVGFVQTSVNSTIYATSSDYRLKESVTYDFDATTRLKQLKPCRFNFIADETNTLVDGFLAHEAQAVVPECVTGEKDAVDADGNIDPQGIDQSKLVPLLVKTIQELEARITTLENA